MEDIEYLNGDRMTEKRLMIKLSVPCECGGTLKRHSSYTGQIYWYCNKCNKRIDGDEFND